MFKFNKYHQDISSEEGFTLVEILVVILIIGILASIAIPVFLNQRAQANDANVESSVHNAAVAVESYFADNPTQTTINLNEIKKYFVKSPDVRLTFTGTLEAYCVEGNHKNGNKYVVKNNNYGTLLVYSSSQGKSFFGNATNEQCSKVGGGKDVTHIQWN